MKRLIIFLILFFPIILIAQTTNYQIDNINLTAGSEIFHGDFVVCVMVNFSDTSPKELYTVADGYMILAVHIEVTTTWNDGAKAFEVGDDTDPDGFIEDMGADLGTLGYYGVDHDEWGAYLWHVAGSHSITKFYNTGDTIDATFVGSGTGGSQGVCMVCIHVSRMK